LENSQKTVSEGEKSTLLNQAGSGRQECGYFGEETRKTTKLPTSPVLLPSDLGNKAAPLLDKKAFLPTQRLFHSCWGSEH
jgi:hypothetical protein